MRGMRTIDSPSAGKSRLCFMRRSKKADARSLVASMQSLGRYDLGGFTVDYGPGQNHGSKFVELAMVTRDGKLKN